MDYEYDIVPVKETNFEIHEIANVDVRIFKACILIKFYDLENKLLSIKFEGFLGFKQTKIDCFTHLNYIREYGRPSYLGEVKNSKWLDKINKNMKDNQTANEWKNIENIHHYLFVTDDDVFEILAFDNFKVKDLGVTR